MYLIFGNYKKDIQITILQIQKYGYMLLLFLSRLFSFTQIFLEYINNSSLHITANIFKKVLYVTLLVFSVATMCLGAHSLINIKADTAVNTVQNSGLGSWTGTTGTGQEQATELTFSNQILGIPCTAGTAGCNANPLLGNKKGTQDGAFAFLGSSTSYMYNTPGVTTGEYFAYLKSNAGFVSSVYAAGATQSMDGFTALSLILNLWEWARNLAYLAMALVIIVVAFFILIGGKMGQAEVTVVNAIPRIIIVTLLITFSYSIAALIIDIMNIGLYTVTDSFFGSSGPGSYYVANSVNNELDSTNDVTAYGPNFSLFGIGKTLDLSGVASQTNLPGGFGTISAGGGLPAATIGALTDMINGILSAGNNIIIQFIVSIMVLITSIKIFIAIAKSYITLILMPVAAPFMFLFGALPGRTGMITGWFKHMFSAIMTFITFYIGFCFIYYLSQLVLNNGNLSNMTPPLVGTGASSNFFADMAPIFLFFALPSITTAVEGALGLRGNQAAMATVQHTYQTANQYAYRGYKFASGALSTIFG